MLAPIILFTYNRPWHTEQTLNALMQNELASESMLYVFCDGAKENATYDQQSSIAAVRRVVRSKQWCKSVHIIEADINKGLANSIIEGVSDIISKHGKVIVLEDDLVSSKYFLNYMNNCLDYYQHKMAVFSISSDRPPYKQFVIPKDYEYDVFVSLRFYATGWATWIDRWSQVDWSIKSVEDFLTKSEQIDAFNRGGEDLTNMLNSQKQMKIDSWAIRFDYTHFINHSISILPCYSYIENIGYDGSGINCGEQGGYARKDTKLAKKDVKLLEILYEDKRIINSFYSSFYPKKRVFWKKIVNKLSRVLGRENIFNIKKQVYK